jgi:hypothetical protein
MPEISRFYGIIIKMYFVDHNPPHFHAEYGEHVAEYDIHSLKIIAGKLPSRANALVLEWASIHRDELMRNWEKAQTPERLDKIEPLA